MQSAVRFKTNYFHDRSLFGANYSPVERSRLRRGFGGPTAPARRSFSGDGLHSAASFTDPNACHAARASIFAARTSRAAKPAERLHAFTIARRKPPGGMACRV